MVTYPEVNNTGRHINVHIHRNCDPYNLLMESLKISESVNRRRTDNTMAKGKRTKGKTTIYKTLHIKLKIE
jgi:hypothetical protein